MVSKSEEIRQMARNGMMVADIARSLSIRYQFAYNVLHAGKAAEDRPPRMPKVVAVRAEKQILTKAHLLAAGFLHSATWVASDDRLPVLDRELEKRPGVYAFVVDDRAVYVGLASMGLAKRIYFYARPGVSQRTSLRLNQTLREHLAEDKVVQVYTVTPPDGEWNGLPVDNCAGLELGLIRSFALPWNMRSAG